MLSILSSLLSSSHAVPLILLLSLYHDCYRVSSSFFQKLCFRVSRSIFQKFSFKVSSSFFQKFRPSCSDCKEKSPCYILVASFFCALYYWYTALKQHLRSIFFSSLILTSIHFYIGDKMLRCI